MKNRRRSRCLKRFLLPILAVAATTATAAPPAAPSNVVAFAPGVGMPQVSWKDNSSDEEKFEAQVIVVGESAVAASTSVGRNMVVARFSGGEGLSATIRVRAVRGTEASEWISSAAFTVPTANFAFGTFTDSFQYASDGVGGTEDESFEYTVPRVGSATPTSYFLEDLPGCAIDSTGKITGVLPSAGVSARGFYGAIVNGETFKQPFYLRSESTESAPLVVDPIPPASVVAGKTASVHLNDIFINPEIPSLVRFNTNLGSFEASLFKIGTPLTVANFLSYVRSGAYTSSVVHRTSPGFVVQGGGFTQLADRTSADWKPIVTASAIRNEPGFSNERGTVAMAKTGGSPDSATCQWFVSTGAANPANLDYQNGGFAAFGKVLGSGMTPVDDINDLQTRNYSVRLQNAGTQTFNDIPVNNPTPPATLEAASEVVLQSVEELPTLTYSIVSNSNPGAVTASINGMKLSLAGLSQGTSEIVVKATDGELETVEGTIQVTVSPAPPPPTPPDTIAPTAKITAPGSKGKYTGKKLRVSGSATDNVGLLKWQYRLNGSSWKSGGSLSGASKSFSKVISGFKPNANNLEIRVYDTSGRVSATAKRKITLKE